MRGLVDRRAVAVLTRSRGPGGCIQGLRWSSGRGRGGGDSEDGQVGPIGAGVGRGSGLGELGVGLGRGRGRGRGRGSVIAAPEPAPVFSPAPLVPPAAGAGKGLQVPPGSGIPSPRVTIRGSMLVNPNADKARASAWGSLSQILAVPGKPVVQAIPVSPSSVSQEPQPGVRPESQEVSTSGNTVQSEVQNVAKEKTSRTSTHVSQSSTRAEISSTVTAEPESQASDASYVAMIKYHQAAGRLAEVDQVYEEMQADSVPITIPTYSLLIQIYSQAGQFDKMDIVYKQMRQALTQSKGPSEQSKGGTLGQEQTAVQPIGGSPVVSPRSMKGSAAPDRPSTVEEQIVVKSSAEGGLVEAEHVHRDTSVTHSNELSARVGEWDSPVPQQSLGSSGTVVQEEVASPLVPPLRHSTPLTVSSEELKHGKVFAQSLEESKKLQSFRGLLSRPPPGDSPAETSRIGAFNPFNLPTTPSPSIYGGTAGRGRGAPLPQVEGQAGRGRGAPRSHGVKQDAIGAEVTEVQESPVHVQLSRKEARERALALLAKGEESRAQRRAPSPPSASPARPQLSREDAVQRAVSVMKEGVERNLTREEEKRRRGGAVESFSDATNFLTDRFRRRTPDSTSQQARGPQAGRDRFKRPPRFIQRRVEEHEPQVPLTLREMTEEDEKRLRALEEEEQFKSALHSKFLVDFEPEYAMEYFGINPDIDETPQKPLAEILAEAKPYLMVEGMTDEQWQGEVQDVLEKAPHLEKLVNMYAGPNRLTAKEQNARLQAVAENMPAHATPEIQDFMSRALLTLQNNPGIRIKEKERLMNKFVSGLSSF